MVVVVDPGTQCECAVVARLVADGVSPVAQQGLDESFGLAVGARPIGAGADLPDVKAGTGRGEGLGEIAGAVVGHDAFDAHAALGEPSHGALEEACAGVAAFVVEDLDVRDAAVVVDGDVHTVPAVAPVSVSTGLGSARDAVSGPAKPAQLLDVEMHELARTTPLIAIGRLRRLESAETVQPQTRQHRTHSRNRHPQLGRYS